MILADLGIEISGVLAARIRREAFEEPDKSLSEGPTLYPSRNSAILVITACNSAYRLTIRLTGLQFSLQLKLQAVITMPGKQGVTFSDEQKSLIRLPLEWTISAVIPPASGRRPGPIPPGILQFPCNSKSNSRGAIQCLADEEYRYRMIKKRESGSI